MMEMHRAKDPAVDVRALVTRLRGDSLRYAPAVILPAVISVAGVVVFTRLLDTAAYGVYSVTVAVLTIATVVGAGWIEQAVLRYLPEAERGSRPVDMAGYVIGAAAVVCAGVAVLAAVVAALAPRYFPGATGLVGPAAALLVGEIGFTALCSVLQARLRSRAVSAFRVAGAVLRFAFALGFLLWVGRDVHWLFAGAAIGRGAVTLVLLAVVGRRSGHWERPRFDRAALRRFAAYGVPMVGWTLGSQVLGLSDRFVIGAFHGPGPVGIYSANYNLVSMGFGLLGTPLLMAAHPLIVAAWTADGGRDIGRVIAAFSRVYIAVVTPVLVALAVCSGEVVDVLLAESFREGSRIIPVLVLGSFAWGFAMYGHKGLELVERTRLMFALVAATAVFNLAANLLLVPAYGYPAAALTTLASYFLYPLLVYVASRRYLRWRIPWATLARAGAGGLAAGMLGVAARARLHAEHPALIAVATTLVIVGAYAAMATLWLRAHRGRRETS